MKTLSIVLSAIILVVFSTSAFANKKPKVEVGSACWKETGNGARTITDNCGSKERVDADVNNRHTDSKGRLLSSGHPRMSNSGE